MAERKSFIMYKSWAPLIEAMNDREAGMLFKAIFDYQLTGEEPPRGCSFFPMFNLFKATFEKDLASYMETCETNKRIAAERERKKTKHNEPLRSVTNRNEPLRSATDNDNDIDNDSNKRDIGKRARAFQPPDVNEVRSYCQERNNNVDPERFVDFYTAKGWFVGKNKMKDWRAAVRSWEKEENARSGTTKKREHNYPQRDYDLDAIERALIKNG